MEEHIGRKENFLSKRKVRGVSMGIAQKGHESIII